MTPTQMVSNLQGVISSIQMRAQEIEIDGDTAKLALDAVLTILTTGEKRLTNLHEADATILQTLIHTLRLSKLLLKPIAHQLADMGFEKAAILLEHVHVVIQKMQSTFEQRVQDMQQGQDISMSVNTAQWSSSELEKAIEVIKEIREHV